MSTTDFLQGGLVKRIAEKIIRMTGSSSKLIYAPLPQDDPTQRQPDISQAKKELGWTPGFTLDEGLAPTIEYFRTFIS